MTRAAAIARSAGLPAVCLAVSLGAADPAAAAGPLCLINPFQPSCCPMPCPVIDQSKLIKYADEAKEAWQKVDECRAMVDQYVTLATAFGPDGPLAGELRRIPAGVTGVFASFKPALPEMLRPGDLSDPRAVAEILKKALFDPPSQDSRTTAGLVQAETRARLDREEALQGLASGLHGYGRLADLAADRSRQTVRASQARDARGDLAANAAARQALLDNIGGLKQLLSAWASMQAVAAAKDRPGFAGTVGNPASTDWSMASALQARADQAERARRLKSAVDRMDATISAITSLHNERHAVNLILSQYPGLWNTVASDNAAIQFRNNDEAKARTLLAGLFEDGDAALGLARQQLLARDATGWKDGGAKSQAARAAAEAVAGTIAATPTFYGRPRLEPFVLTPEYAAALVDVFASWLEDDKLERFWQPLRADADKAIGGLDRRIGEINRRRGFDITAAAGIEENRLLAEFDQEIGQLPAIGSAGLADSQAAFVAAVVSAFRDTAAQARGDTVAANFVSVAWPQ